MRGIVTLILCAALRNDTLRCNASDVVNDSPARFQPKPNLTEPGSDALPRENTNLFAAFPRKRAGNVSVSREENRFYENIFINYSMNSIIPH